MRPNLAIEAALALAANPALVGPMRRQPLPPGVSGLLQLLADGVDTDRRLSEAIQCYVQNVMLFPGAPPRRVLGVRDDAPREKAREHMRLLMLWLHPDHNQAEWRSGFAARVLEAWRHLAKADAAPTPGRAARPTQKSRRVRVAWVPIETPVRRRRGLRYALLALCVAGVWAGVSHLPNSWREPLLGAITELGASR